MSDRPTVDVCLDVTCLYFVFHDRPLVVLFDTERGAKPLIGKVIAPASHARRPSLDLHWWFKWGYRTWID